MYANFMTAMETAFEEKSKLYTEFKVYMNTYFAEHAIPNVRIQYSGDRYHVGNMDFLLENIYQLSINAVPVFEIYQKHVGTEALEREIGDAIYKSFKESF